MLTSAISSGSHASTREPPTNPPAYAEKHEAFRTAMVIVGLFLYFLCTPGRERSNGA
jgi:hypothetical protein